MSLFKAELHEKILHYLARYETKRSAILPILHAIQDAEQWIQPQHIEALEQEFQLSKVEVQEVATFYSMYRLKEPKPFRILFCDNLVCTMMGAKECLAKLDTLVEQGDRAKLFSVQGVPCLGVCDAAPAMLINKQRYHKVKPEALDGILTDYANRHKPYASELETLAQARQEGRL